MAGDGEKEVSGDVIMVRGIQGRRNATPPDELYSEIVRLEEKLKKESSWRGSVSINNRVCNELRIGRVYLNNIKTVYGSDAPSFLKEGVSSREICLMDAARAIRKCKAEGVDINDNNSWRLVIECLRTERHKQGK